MGSIFSPPKIQIQDPAPAAQVAPPIEPAPIPETLKPVGLEDLASLRQMAARKRTSRSSLVIDPATSVGSGQGVGI